MIRILFIGNAWQGSSARSLREALAARPTVMVRDIGDDTFIPTYRHLPLRLANRLLRGLQEYELRISVLDALKESGPDVVVVYKGAGINGDLINQIRGLGIPVANVFPDYSPHAYGRQLQEALGLYDLVISTKP